MPVCQNTNNSPSDHNLRFLNENVQIAIFPDMQVIPLDHMLRTQSLVLSANCAPLQVLNTLQYLVLFITQNMISSYNPDICKDCHLNFVVLQKLAVISLAST